SLISLNELTVPYSETCDKAKELWSLLSSVNDLKVPKIDELQKWNRVAENIAAIKLNNEEPYGLKFVWGIERLLMFLEKQKTLLILNEALNIEAPQWLNSLYPWIIKTNGSFPLEKPVLLNQRGVLRSAEGMLWDKA